MNVSEQPLSWLRIEIDTASRIRDMLPTELIAALGNVSVN
jgi:hypothetical protein